MPHEYLQRSQTLVIWIGLEFDKSQRAVENREKMEKTGCKIICGAPTTLAVKGLMMMMMMMSDISKSWAKRSGDPPPELISQHLEIPLVV